MLGRCSLMLLYVSRSTVCISVQMLVIEMLAPSYPMRLGDMYIFLVYYIYLFLYKIIFTKMEYSS